MPKKVTAGGLFAAGVGLTLFSVLLRITMFVAFTPRGGGMQRLAMRYDQALVVIDLVQTLTLALGPALIAGGLVLRGLANAQRE